MILSDVSNNSKSDELPLSRFWACFFCCSIFALLWTGKIQKTRKWIPLFTLFVAVWFVADYMLYSEYYTSPDEFVNLTFYIEPNQKLEIFMYNVINEHSSDISNILIEEIAFLISFVMIILYNLVIILGIVLANVYFMLKWVTAYNIHNYNYKSKREWKRVNYPPNEYIVKLKQLGSKTENNIKDVSAKIGENLKDVSVKTGENLKDVSTWTSQKVSESTKNLKINHRLSEENKRHQIEEWHKLMLMGVLTEKEFEQKKSNFLKECDN